MASSGITNEGMATTAKIITADVGETSWDSIGIGTGTTAFDVTDTWLETEQQVASAVGTTVTTAVTDDTMRLVVDAFTFAGSFAITEAIAANANTNAAGESLCRFVFDAVNVTSADELKVTIDVQVKQGA